MTEFKPGSFGALVTKLRKSYNYGDISVNGVNLTSLDGCPEKVSGMFACSDNPALTSLVGGPKETVGGYSAEDCGLTSLDGLPLKIGGFLAIDSNPLTSIKGIDQLTEMDGPIYLNGCSIKSHILGVFLIRGCRGICTNSTGNLGKATEIVNRHIKKGRAGLLPCTQELIEAGLADFAQI
jgi:hypothetical protein